MSCNLFPFKDYGFDQENGEISPRRGCHYFNGNTQLYSYAERFKLAKAIR